MSTLFDLSGKKAIITGSSKGIGKATAIRLAEHGAKVVITSRKIDACEEVASEINKTYGADTAIAIACNISDKDQLEKLHNDSVAWCGDIDTLICNAAINPYFGPSLNIPDSAFEKIMRSNVQSNFWLSNMVIPNMIKNKNGSIVIISSIAGLHGNSLLGAYAISKAAEILINASLLQPFSLLILVSVNLKILLYTFSGQKGSSPIIKSSNPFLKGLISGVISV